MLTETGPQLIPLELIFLSDLRTAKNIKLPQLPGAPRSSTSLRCQPPTHYTHYTHPPGWKSFKPSFPLSLHSRRVEKAERRFRIAKVSCQQVVSQLPAPDSPTQGTLNLWPRSSSIIRPNRELCRTIYRVFPSAADIDQNSLQFA